MSSLVLEFVFTEGGLNDGENPCPSVPLHLEGFRV